MFINNVPQDLYISSPEELQSLLGQEIYSVGQGGVSTIGLPYNLGHLTKVDMETKRFFTGVRSWGASLLDRHVLPQSYNNWYLCRDEKQAIKLSAFLLEAWESNPSYEAARLKYVAESAEWGSWLDDYRD